MHYSSVFLGVNLGLGDFAYLLGEAVLFGGFSSTRPITPYDSRDAIAFSTRTNRSQCNWRDRTRPCVFQIPAISTGPTDFSSILERAVGQKLSRHFQKKASQTVSTLKNKENILVQVNEYAELTADSVNSCSQLHSTSLNETSCAPEWWQERDQYNFFL